MPTHAPPPYRCPFCDLIAGVATGRNRRADIVLHDDARTAFVSPKWWPSNPGHVLVGPNEHVENS